MQIKLFKTFQIKLQIHLTNVPITKLSLKEMKSRNNPWLTKGILKPINKKNAIYRKFMRAKNLHSKEIYHLYSSI